MASKAPTTQKFTFDALHCGGPGSPRSSFGEQLSSCANATRLERWVRVRDSDWFFWHTVLEGEAAEPKQELCVRAPRTCSRNAEGFAVNCMLDRRPQLAVS
eukprot:3871228-Amphidinium_carterae.1